jgi:hypothetical protein
VQRWLTLANVNRGFDGPHFYSFPKFARSAINEPARIEITSGAVPSRVTQAMADIAPTTIMSEPTEIRLNQFMSPCLRRRESECQVATIQAFASSTSSSVKTRTNPGIMNPNAFMSVLYEPLSVTRPILSNDAQ